MSTEKENRRPDTETSDAKKRRGRKKPTTDAQEAAIVLSEILRERGRAWGDRPEPPPFEPTPLGNERPARPEQDPTPPIDFKPKNKGPTIEPPLNIKSPGIKEKGVFRFIRLLFANQRKRKRAETRARERAEAATEKARTQARYGEGLKTKRPTRPQERPTSPNAFMPEENRPAPPKQSPAPMEGIVPKEKRPSTPKQSPTPPKAFLPKEKRPPPPKQSPEELLGKSTSGKRMPPRPPSGPLAKFSSQETGLPPKKHHREKPRPPSGTPGALLRKSHSQKNFYAEDLKNSTFAIILKNPEKIDELQKMAKENATTMGNVTVINRTDNHDSLIVDLDNMQITVDFDKKSGDLTVYAICEEKSEKAQAELLDTAVKLLPQVSESEYTVKVLADNTINKDVEQKISPASDQKYEA